MLDSCGKWTNSCDLGCRMTPSNKQALRVKNPEARLRAFLTICGSMRTDDSGGQQPKYRMDTYRIMAEFEKPKVCPPLLPRHEQTAIIPPWLQNAPSQDHVRFCQMCIGDHPGASRLQDVWQLARKGCCHERYSLERWWT